MVRMECETIITNDFTSEPLQKNVGWLFDRFQRLLQELESIVWVLQRRSTRGFAFRSMDALNAWRGAPSTSTHQQESHAQASPRPRLTSLFGRLPSGRQPNFTGGSSFCGSEPLSLCVFCTPPPPPPLPHSPPPSGAPPPGHAWPSCAAPRGPARATAPGPSWGATPAPAPRAPSSRPRGRQPVARRQPRGPGV